MFPLVALGYVWNSRPARRSRTWVWILAGTVVVLAPYVAYAARYPADLASQLAVFGDRGAFWKPNFFVDNVLAEPRRYAHLVRWPPVLDLPGPPGLLEAPLSPWLLVIGIWPALGYLAWRRRAADRIGDRLLISSFVCFGGLLLLLDQTKVPLYALLLLPSACLCVAAGLVAGMRWSLSRWWTRWASLSASAALGLVLALEGVHAFQVDWTAANQVTPYLALGQQIDDALEPGARVLGPERWWWALHERPYLSLRSVWFQWTARVAQGERPEFSDWVVNTQTDSLIVNIIIRDDVLAVSGGAAGAILELPGPLHDANREFR